MSIHAVEKLLYEICNSGERADQFRNQPEALLARAALTAQERNLIGKLDVQGLTDYKVNPMLIMTTWNTLKGPDQMGAYLGRLNAPRSDVAQGAEHG
jgi:hypothetical protein